MPEGQIAQDAPTASSTRRLRHAERLVFALLLGWLAAAAWLVRAEIFDGYHNICNARYFLGYTDDYQAIRFPLMALLMVPAEAVKQLLGLHPLEVRPHHVSMALLHGLYLIAVYAGLVAIFGRRPRVLLAFVGVVFNLAFFAMAPFISSDILPGALLLWMVVLLDRFLCAPRAREWIGLVVLGFLAASLKHVFGTFWIAILLAAALIPQSEGRPRRESLRLFGMLALGAALSGIATWLLESFSLASELDGVPIWKRPWVLLMWFRDVAEAGQDREMSAPAWLYLRNLWAYGWLIVTGAFAGVCMAVRSRASRVERLAAIVLIVVVAAMQISPVKNVRFLSAVLPVAAIPAAVWLRVALRRRVLTFALVALLLVDAYHVLPLATRIAEPFFRESALRRFLEPLDPARPHPRVIWSGDYLSFTPERPSLVSGDLYHDLYHFGPRQLRVLYGLREGELLVVPYARLDAFLTRDGSAGDLLIRASPRLLNPETWDPLPPPRREWFGQSIALISQEERGRTLRVLNRCRFAGVPLAFSCDEVKGAGQRIPD